MTSAKKTRLSEIVGGSYGKFWHSKHRYRVVKGSRSSKKSTTTALWYITNMMKHPEANTLVVRKVYRTIKDSCYAQLKWAASRLGVMDKWEFSLSPLEATYKPTGQKIYFRGLDDPLKITSITVETGYLCWLWLEECYEIMDEADFDTLDESIRGWVPDTLWKQTTITFNPWNEKHWLKRRFFDVDDPDILALTRNYTCNEFLDESDRARFEDMKVRNPRRYRVAGCGDWGIVEGVIFENWKEERFTLEDIKGSRPLTGLDFGYTNDPTALFVGFLSENEKRIYVWDELYETGMSNQDICRRIEQMGYDDRKITADSAEPKSIAELQSYGLYVKGARKGKDSVNNGIGFIQNYEIIIHPRCTNFITEISNYTWDKDKFGKALNIPIDDFNHLMDAMRYGVEDYMKESQGPQYNSVGGGL